MPSSCESLGAGYLACPRFNRMLTLCKGISRDRAAASENESWSGFVPNFIVYTNPKSTLRFRRRRCDFKKKKKKRKLETSVLLVRLRSAFAMCVCVCVGGGGGGGGNPNVPEAGITTWAIFQCFSLCRGGKKENAGQGIGCVGKCHVVFFFFSFFRRLTPRTWRRRTWLPCALLSLSLSLSLLSGTCARASRGCRSRSRSGSSLHLFGFALSIP